MVRTSDLVFEGSRVRFSHGFSSFQVKMFTGSVRVLLTSASLKLKSNYLDLGYSSYWQMIKETCWQIIYFLMSKFFPCRLISN